MLIVYALISIIAMLTAAIWLARMTHPRTRVESLLTLALAITTLVFFTGLGASTITQFRSLGCWALMSVLLLALVSVPLLFSRDLRAVCLRKGDMMADIEGRIKAAGTRGFTIRILLLLAITVGIVALVNLVFILSFEPSTQDALSTHLARMAYFLQQGSMAMYDANRWEQMAYPKVSMALFAYVYLLFGRLANATELVQYLAYFVSMIAVYGITRQLGNSRRGSLFSALVFGLLTICIVETTSTQTDLLMTACIGSTLYYLLAYRSWRQPKYLALAATAFVLAVAIKATFVLTVPALLVAGVCLLFPLYRAKTLPVRHLLIGVAALAGAVILIAFPAGYWDNMQTFGDPFGPTTLRSTLLTSEQKTPATLLGTGGMNFLRYGVDNLQLDGTWPLPYAHAISWGLIAVPRAVFTGLGLDLQSSFGTRPYVAGYRFSYDHPWQMADDSVSTWGTLGLLLLWPVLLITLFQRRASRDHRIFALAGLVYAITLSSIILYDPFHGRFLTTGALFVVPLLAPWLAARTRLARGYLVVALIIGCVTALTAALFHNQTFFFDGHFGGKEKKSTYSLSPEDQLTRMCPSPMLRRFEYFVPDDAVVAMHAMNASEFLFFGRYLSRTLRPVRIMGLQELPIPAGTDFLVYDRNDHPFQTGDIWLSGTSCAAGDFYLRPLTKTARAFVAAQQQALQQNHGAEQQAP